jgi:hypothetical protein
VKKLVTCSRSCSRPATPLAQLLRGRKSARTRAWIGISDCGVGGGVARLRREMTGVGVAVPARSDVDACLRVPVKDDGVESHKFDEMELLN